MTEQVELELEGHQLILSAHRAVYLRNLKLLLLSDLHLGKSHIFRRAGISVPEGSSGEDLKRLSLLVQRFKPSEVYVLGDVVHGAQLDAPSRTNWFELLRAFPDVRFLVVAGNHDRHLAGMDLGVSISWESILLDGLLLSHAPENVKPAGARLNVCGHIHPVVRIPGESRRFPSFCAIPNRLVLPAFSTFTGGWKVDKTKDTRAWATHADEIVRVM